MRERGGRIGILTYNFLCIIVRKLGGILQGTDEISKHIQYKAGTTYGKGRIAISIVIRNGKQYAFEVLSEMSIPLNILIIKVNYGPAGYQCSRYHHRLVRGR